MNKLQEIFVMGKPNIVSERKRPSGGTMTVVVPFVQADKKNSNGRTYPLALLKREVSRIQGAVKRHSMIGTGDHPVSGFPDIATSSHILQKVWLDNEGKGYAQMKIIPTPRGKTIQTLINHGAELGVSSRGYGNVSGAGIVQNDYKLTGIDIVQNPSYKEGVFNKSDVFESLNLEEESLDAQEQKELEEAVNELETESFLSAVESGFKGSQEEWAEIYGSNLRKMVGLPELTEEKIEKISSAPIQKRVTEAQVYLEARLAGIDPRVYAEKLNASLDKEELSEEEKTARAEMQRAGNLSRPKLVQREEEYPDGEKRMAWVTEKEIPEEQAKRVSEEMKKLRERKVLTEEEKAEIVAKKTGATPERVKEIWAFERKKKEEERKKSGKINLSVREEIASGFGSETRPESRRISKKILDK